MGIIGYRIRGTTDIISVQTEMDKIGDKLMTLCSKEYHKLLGEEIAFLCDCIATNVLTRKPNENIYEIAVMNLNKKIQSASYTALPKYNFKVYVRAMPFGKDTYLQVICSNDALLKAFRSLEDYSLSDEEFADDGNAKKKMWEQLFSLYKNRGAFTIDLSKDVVPDKKKIVYPEKKDRCAALARHTVTNQYLNQIGGGEQIPPYRLMPYMDLAIEMLSSKEAKRVINESISRLKMILPDLKSDDSFVFEDRGSDTIAEPKAKEN